MSVCSLVTFPLYCTDPDVTWGNGRVAPICAVLGGFAVDARVSLLWQHSANAKCQRVLCTRSMPGLFCRMTNY